MNEASWRMRFKNENNETFKNGQFSLIKDIKARTRSYVRDVIGSSAKTDQEISSCLTSVLDDIFYLTNTDYQAAIGIKEVKRWLRASSDFSDVLQREN